MTPHGSAAAPPSDPFTVVRSGYDRIGERYRDWSQHSPVRLQQLQRLLDRLTTRSTVLDLGCGPGVPATRLLATQHDVIGVDASQVQLSLARQAAPRALLVQADMTQLHLRPRSLDAVASFYALGHVPEAHHEALFGRIATWLRPGGLLLTSAPLGVGDDHDEEWLGVPMFFGGIGEQATREAVRRSGLVIESSEVIEEDEGDGALVQFLWLLARKPT